jgi:anti-anti-sigma factor
MDILQNNRDGVTVIAPAGRIDTTTSGAVEEAVRRAVDGGARDLVVDFAAVEYISSAGLRVFLVLAKRMRDLHGRLVLCGMPEPVRQVFRLAGFMPLFRVEPSQAAALARIATPS